jgi:serine/threonine protein kinase/integral membrane sensor domain MASE1
MPASPSALPALPVLNRRLTAAVATAYAVSAAAGFVFAIPPGNVTAVFPASGVALAAVFLLGAGALPGVWLGSMLANTVAFAPKAPPEATTGTLVLLGCLTGAGAASGAWVGARAVRDACGGRFPFDRGRDAFLFLMLGGPAACLISPTVGVSAQAVAGLVPPESVPYAWLTWWLGDAAGAVVVAPLILTWRRRAGLPDAAAGWAEAGLFAAGVVGVGWLVFAAGRPVMYVLLILIVWSAFRFGDRGAAAAAAAVSTIAALAFVGGTPLPGTEGVPPHVGLLFLQLFIGLSCGTALVTAGVVTERQRAAEETAALNRTLEERVAARTARLEEARRELDARLAELSRANAELAAGRDRADRIFSAFAEALPGKTLDGKYRLGERIGSGGYGVVFRARHLLLERELAIKVFRPMPGNDSAAELERFLREGMSASRVVHPNAVAVLDSGVSAEGIAYLAMELLEGRTLDAEMDALGGPLPPARAATIIRQVCSALAEAHRLGVIHRDIKPENVFLHQSGSASASASASGSRSGSASGSLSGQEVVKVLDFGIAKVLHDDRGTRGGALTEAGTFLGTPEFIAPERLFGDEPVDGRSDVYSVGVMLFAMLTGRLPFPRLGSGAHGTLELFRRKAEETPPTPSAVVPGLPEALDRLVLRALAKSPSQRPTAEEMENALAEWEAGQASTPANPVRAEVA